MPQCFKNHTMHYVLSAQHITVSIKGEGVAHNNEKDIRGGTDVRNVAIH